MEVEPEFIGQAELNEGRGDSGAADSHVIAWLPFQPGDLFGYVLPDQPGILPDLIKGLRKNDLGHFLPDAGVLYLVLWR